MMEQKRAAKDSTLQSRYGISLTLYEHMEKEQKHSCAICGELTFDVATGEKIMTLCVDHNHSTNRVRGLLCTRCNSRLAVMDDLYFFYGSIAYLSKYDSDHPILKLVLEPKRYMGAHIMLMLDKSFSSVVGMLQKCHAVPGTVRRRHAKKYFKMCMDSIQSMLDGSPHSSVDKREPLSAVFQVAEQIMEDNMPQSRLEARAKLSSSVNRNVSE